MTLKKVKSLTMNAVVYALDHAGQNELIYISIIFIPLDTVLI